MKGATNAKNDTSRDALPVTSKNQPMHTEPDATLTGQHKRVRQPSAPSPSVRSSSPSSPPPGKDPSPDNDRDYDNNNMLSFKAISSHPNSPRIYRAVKSHLATIASIVEHRKAMTREKSEDWNRYCAEIAAGRLLPSQPNAQGEQQPPEVSSVQAQEPAFTAPQDRSPLQLTPPLDLSLGGVTRALVPTADVMEAAIELRLNHANCNGTLPTPTALLCNLNRRFPVQARCSSPSRGTVTCPIPCLVNTATLRFSRHQLQLMASRLSIKASLPHLCHRVISSISTEEIRCTQNNNTEVAEVDMIRGCTRIECMRDDCMRIWCNAI
jgi:hypothetical protein